MAKNKDKDDVKLAMRFVTLLEATPGNRGTAKGQPILMLVVSHDGAIETISFDMRDARALVCHALIALADTGDEFALSLLEKHFREGPLGDGWTLPQY